MSPCWICPREPQCEACMDPARPLWLACKQRWKLTNCSFAAGRYQLATDLIIAPTISQTMCRLEWPDNPSPASLREGYIQESTAAVVSLAQ